MTEREYVGYGDSLELARRLVARFGSVHVVRLYDLQMLLEAVYEGGSIPREFLKNESARV